MTLYRGWVRHASVLVAVCMVLSVAHAQSAIDKFSYYGPGIMTHSSDGGLMKRQIYFPDIVFPVRVGPQAAADGGPLHAYPNSQVYRPHGFDVNDPRLYAYPWVDTVCETNHHGGPMPLCPSKPHYFHQGVDIRPHSPRKEFYDVIAAQDGQVIAKTQFTYVQIRWAVNDGSTCEYEHLSPILVAKGQKVKKGDVIGKVSNVMGSTGTSIHLHFQCEASVQDLGIVTVPVYTSLITAYRRAWGLPESTQNGALVKDPARERDGPVTGGTP